MREEEPGSYLRIPELSELPDELRGVVEGSPDELSMRASSLRPRHFMAFMSLAAEIMDPNTSTLTTTEREIIAVVVSAENRCANCLVNHTQALAALMGDELRAARVAANHRTVNLTEREQAIADFASKLTRTPAEVREPDTQGLRHVGLADEAIAHVIETVALFNFTNRIATALGLKPTLASSRP